MMNRIQRPSPNFEPRPPEVPVDLIVLHYTDMRSAEDALERLCDPQAKVSAHFLIGKEGTLYELVNPLYRAWHAGVSSWQGETDINSRSIGIELDNGGHGFGPEPFPAAQMSVLEKLLTELTTIYAIPPHRIVGHSDVAPLRKKDPGELFPWGELAQKGFGLWPSSPPTQVSVLRPGGILEIQQALKEIGYACPQTRVWDEESQAVGLAFQRHFMPQALTGEPSEEMGRLLQALVERVRKEQKG